MDFLWRLLVIPILAIPFFAWYIVMTNIWEEKYPKWMQKVFGIKRFGKALEYIIVFIAVLIVLYMILFFRLPSR